MLERGAVLLLSLHHLEELLCHGNEDVVAHRLAWLQSRPTVAWIKPYVGEGGLGSICDLLIAELRAAADIAMSPTEIRGHAWQEVIRFGSGAEAMSAYDSIWPHLRTICMARTRRKSEIAAIVQGKIPSVGKKRLRDFLNGSLRHPAEVAQHLQESHSALAEDVARRGDRHVEAPRELASEFLLRVVHEARNFDPASKNVVHDELVRRGVDPHELDPYLPMSEVFDLIEFRQRIDVIADHANVALTPLRTVETMHRIPSWIVERGLRKFRQSRSKNPGSDLVDRHLGCLGAYADLTFVDRRTHEDFLRAKRGRDPLSAILKRVEKRGSAPAMLRALSRLAPR